MALFNNSTQPSPFGSTSAVPQPNIGAQFFMGATVIDFNVSADWSSQGGSLNVSLLEDTLDGSKVGYNDSYGTWAVGVVSGFTAPITQKIQDPKILDYANIPATLGSLPIIGSPQHFRFLDPSNNIIFQYDGILESISRNASPNAGKVYSVNLQSPLKLLENCSIMLKSYPGFGNAKEGFPDGISQNGYYKLSAVPTNYAPQYLDTTVNPPFYNGVTLDIDLDASFNPLSSAMQLNEVYENSRPSQNIVDNTPEQVGIAFGANNRNVSWGHVYNIQNVFGVFENESLAAISGYSKFGASRSSEGMRLDMIAYALDELINRNIDGTPLPPKRYFGGNIISGTTTYNWSQVAARNVGAFPYFFGFDVYTFMNQMIAKLGADYIYQGDISSNLLDLVSTLSDYAGMDFLVELNRIQTFNAAAPNYWNGTNTVSNYDCPGSLYDGGSFYLERSFVNSVPGGIISIKLLDRRSLQLSDPTNVSHPFSKIAYQILGYEVPDYGDKGLARINPGDPDPTTLAFENGAFGASYLDPLDDDYTSKGTDGSSIDPFFRNANTSGYGGKFPVETKQHQNTAAQTSALDIYNLRNDASQTQVTIRDNQQSTAKFIVGGLQSRIHKVPQKFIYQYWGEVQINSNRYVCQAALDTQIRSIPVITPILEHDDITDFIMVDVQDILPGGTNDSLQNVAPQGIYPTSVCEIRAAMSNKTNWYNFLLLAKPCILYNLLEGLNIEGTANRLATFVIQPTGVGTNVRVNSSNPNAPLVNKPPGNTTNSSQKTPPKKLVPSGIEPGEDLFKIIDKLFQKVKGIGDTHYGKSWVAWSPQITTKVNDDVANYGEYQRSWTPSQSAYLEPSVYDTFHAPQHNKFLDGGKLKAFANVESTYQNGDAITHRTASISTTPNESIRLNPGTHSLDFSKVSEDSKFQSNFCDGSKVNLTIKVDEEYVFVPYDYFHYYDRGRKPLIDSLGHVFDITYAGSSGPGEVDYPFLVANTNYNIYAGTAKASQGTSLSSMESVTDFYNSIDYRKVASANTYLKKNQILCNDASNTTKNPPNGISNTRLVDDFINLICPDHGVNCITFTKFKTDRIQFPKEVLQDNTSLQITAKRVTNMVLGTGIAPPPPEDKASVRSTSYGQLIYAERCVVPLEAGIPQQSIRHRYGPWFTSHNFLYGGKVEIIQNDDLLPENFIFPLYGTLTSSDSNAPSFAEQLSGFVGMNYAGQALANSIDGHGQFASEDGSITMPGGPLIRRIGDALLTGPYITELSIKVGVQGMETTYSFNSAVKKAGRTNADIVKKLRNMSTFITGK